MTETETLPTDQAAGPARLAEEAALSDPRAAALLADPRWRTAHGRAPRHRFVPERLWAPFEGRRGLHAIRRDTHRAYWWHAVHGDHAIVTQVDDGRTAHRPGAVGEEATCSISQPSHVFAMLDALDVADGMRVLEIGTGTGWNAALLAARLGDDLVVSVEVDPALADDARAALTAAGRRPLVVTGDGAGGWAPGAPYDRVIATCSVHRVPPAWIAQTRAGGIIVTPWATTYETGGALARLAVGSDGTASGPFVRPSPFMWMRAQRPPIVPPDDLADHREQAEDSTTGLDPSEVIAEAAVWPIAVQVPGCRRATYEAPPDAPDAGEATTWFTDDAGSWAAVDDIPGAEVHPVSQHGPRRLWDEVEAAWRWWDGHGRPGLTAFGLTATARGDAHVWYGGPAGPRWPVAAPAADASA